MRYRCQCNYCGYQWVAIFYSKPSDIRCGKRGCNDNNITVREVESTDVFGYAKDLEWWAVEREIARKRKSRLQS